MPSENVQRAALLIADFVGRGMTYKRARRKAIEADPSLNNPGILYYGEQLARTTRQRAGRDARSGRKPNVHVRVDADESDATDFDPSGRGRIVRPVGKGSGNAEEEVTHVRFNPDSTIGEGLEAVNVFVYRRPGESDEALYGRLAFSLSVADPFHLGRSRSDLYNMVKDAFEAGEGDII